MSLPAVKLPDPGAAPEQDLQDAPPWRSDPDYFKVREVLHGVEMMSPRPAPPHAKVGSALGIFLGGPYEYGQGGGPGGWRILDEPELHLGAEIVVPDLAGWRLTRMGRLPDTAFFALAPDWVCEILSPGTARHDRGEKLEIYADHHVPHVWLVDPVLCTLEVLRLHEPEGRYLLLKTHRGGRRVKPEPFDAVPLDLGLVWP